MYILSKFNTFSSSIVKTEFEIQYSHYRVGGTLWESLVLGRKCVQVG